MKRFFSSLLLLIAINTTIFAGCSNYLTLDGIINTDRNYQQFYAGNGSKDTIRVFLSKGFHLCFPIEDCNGNELYFKYLLQDVYVGKGNTTVQVTSENLSQFYHHSEFNSIEYGRLYAEISGIYSFVTEYHFINSFTIIAPALSGTCGENLTWAFDTVSGNLAIYGSGTMTSHPWENISPALIKSVTLPPALTSICDSAFNNCSALTSVTIPNSVTSIGEYAFHGCDALTSITCKATTPPTMGEYAFDWVSYSIPVYVPCGTVSAYNAAGGWSSFYNIQEPLAEYSIQVSASNGIMGTAQVDKNNGCGCNISATANYGYHFVKWSDGNTDNPRSLELTQDTVLTAEFAPNNYTLSIQSDNSERGTTSGDITTTYLDYVTISATANYGYHFSHWNDYNYDNPRKVQVTEDKTYTAYFDKNTYYITKNYDSNQGYVDGYSSGEYLDNIILTADPNYGYHFVQWSDGVTDNPRSFVLTQDTTFVAVFAPNNYTISTLSSDIERGTTSGDITTTYLDYVTISATANYGYHFSHWNDYNYDNPRKVQVTEDKTYTAYFDKNTYYITKNYDSNQGYVDGYSSGEYLDNITLTAEANYGYHFVQWSDGNTDNPRHFILTQDTTFVAEFTPNNYTLSVQSDNSERGTTSGDITTTYLDYVTISATANYGYHFTQWNDGNTDNPRQVQVTEDKTYIAYFDKNTYYITKNYDSNQGYVDGYSSGEYLDNITLTATANYGYHFVQWSDGNTDNPRSLELTKDTVLTAEFASNNYTLSVQSDNSECGTTSGDITTTYLDYVTISATANYGYHFSHWDDYNYDNPRLVQVTEDKTYTAYFDKNTYYITKNYDSNQGYVDGYSSGEYLDNITLTAEANYGYHFVQWLDGNTDNPRHFILTQDTTFSAEFAQTFSGQCGDNLYWSYQNNTLTISGFGEMYDERPWGLFTNEIQTVVLPNGITHIGNDAFSDCTGLNAITIPYTVTSIGDYAFAGCRKLVHVNCYAINPPMAETTSFANYNVYLNVPCDNLQDYQLDMVFGSFKYIQCMEANSENVPTDDVVVTPGTNDVTITWPTAENADTYTIVIQKGNEVFCTLTFNADGQLLNISFVPGRDGNHPAQFATKTTNGLRFTVTGLEESTNYTYDIISKDENNESIETYSGEFKTQSNTPTDVGNLDASTSNVHKLLRNGHLIIVRDGVEHTIMGQEM